MISTSVFSWCGLPTLCMAKGWGESTRTRARSFFSCAIAQARSSRGERPIMQPANVKCVLSRFEFIETSKLFCLFSSVGAWVGAGPLLGRRPFFVFVPHVVAGCELCPASVFCWLGTTCLLLLTSSKMLQVINRGAFYYRSRRHTVSTHLALSTRRSSRAAACARFAGGRRS